MNRIYWIDVLNSNPSNPINPVKELFVLFVCFVGKKLKLETRGLSKLEIRHPYERKRPRRTVRCLGAVRVVYF